MVDDFQKWITLIGAVVAAVASSATLWKSLRVDRGRVVASFGPIDPPFEPGYWLHVISHADHPIRISDYGFIDVHGRLISLPGVDANEPCSDDHVVVGGNLHLQRRGDIFEIGQVLLRDEQIGAFARIAGNERYFMGFNSNVSPYRRLWIRFKHLCGAHTYQT